jgi:hypothetical protein
MREAGLSDRAPNLSASCATLAPHRTRDTTVAHAVSRACSTAWMEMRDQAAVRSRNEE